MGPSPATPDRRGPLDPGAAKEADKVAGDKPDTSVSDQKRPKKEKDSKGMKLIYSDNETSPEEKMARLPRYAFTPAIKA